MKTISKISDYCTEVNIPPPKFPSFDIRKFEDNMKSINAKQYPFKHEFYAIGLKMNESKDGQPSASLFFNVPYQIITWDIELNWKGWYILFDKVFVKMNPAWQNFTSEFSFFKSESVMLYTINEYDTDEIANLFCKIFEEYHSNEKDRLVAITSYTQLLLLIIRRILRNIPDTSKGTDATVNRYGVLFSKFQQLLQSHIESTSHNSQIHSTSFYARLLHMHPYHLNRVVKNITGKTASNIIQEQVLLSAKSLLNLTNLSVKEIAYRLHFSDPSHFNFFFKKLSGVTPFQYRELIRSNDPTSIA
jgi:AraC-like DNA-binding protein